MLRANHAQVLQKSVSVCKFCSAFVSQVRDLRFEEEVEKRRVLEDALHVLATEHHALECSIGAHEVTERSPKIKQSHNGPFSSCQRPLCQNEVKCSAFDMEMICHPRASESHFHKKGCALGKWPMIISVLRRLASWYFHIKADTV